jgi:hypothetical protein
MPKEFQKGLTDKEKEELLTILEEQGKTKWFKKWKEHMAIPQTLNPLSINKEEREKILRYLLLRALINQQARFEKVRELSIKLVEEFSDYLIFEPYKISELKLFEIFKTSAGSKGSLLYKVGSLGGIKPISLFAYRFKAYEGFIKWLNENNTSFYDLAKNKLVNGKSVDLFKFLNDHPILYSGWVGSDSKACRMLTNWIIFLFSEIWKEKFVKMKDTLMIVDGHVGKVFCRTGLLSEILYERNRPYIIQASKMRLRIEKIVYDFGKIPFYVDNGAFYIFEEGFCTDISPNCKICPISKLCRKYTKWTAYQKWKD